MPACAVHADRQTTSRLSGGPPPQKFSAKTFARLAQRAVRNQELKTMPDKASFLVACLVLGKEKCGLVLRQDHILVCLEDGGE